MEGWRGGSADAGTVSHLRRLDFLRDCSQRLRAGLFFCRAYGAEEEFKRAGGDALRLRSGQAGVAKGAGDPGRVRRGLRRR
jgi:hypothetical protein